MQASLPPVHCSAAFSRPAREDDDTEDLVVVEEVEDVGELPLSKFPAPVWFREWTLAWIELDDVYNWYLGLHDNDKQRSPGSGQKEI